MSNEKRSKDGLITFVLNNKALLLMLIMFLVCSMISPYFMTFSNIRNVLRQISTSCVLAFGYTCIFSSANIDLSVGYYVGLLGVLSALLDTRTSLPFALIVVITVVVGIFCGMLNAAIGLVIKLPMFIVTLSMGQIYKGVCYVISNNSPVSGISESFKFLGQGYIGFIPFPVLVMAVFGLIVYILLNKTIFGRQAIASGGNKVTARLAGININKTTLLVYLISGIGCAVTALMLTGRAASAQVTAGQGMEMDAIAAVVIGGTPMKGGKAKVVGTFFGVLLIGLLSNVLNLLGIDSNYQYILKGVMILIAMTLDKVSETYFNNQLKKAVEK